MFIREKERKLLGTFYIYGCVSSGFALAWIYWIVYFLDKGFNFPDIGLALALNGLALFALQVPAGALADTIGRKPVAVAGYAAYAIVLCAMPFASDPLTLAALFGLLAVPMAMTTGIVEAWIVDELKSSGADGLVSEYFTKAEAIANAGLAAASVLAAAIIVFFSMDLIWFLHGAAMLAAAAILFFQREHFAPTGAGLLENAVRIAEKFRTGAKFAASSKPVMNIIAAAFFTFAAVEIAAISWNPFLEELGLPREYFGMLIALGAAACVFVPFYAKRFSRSASCDGAYLAAHSFLFALAPVIVVFAASPLAGAALFIFWSLRYASLVPVLDPRFQEMVPCKIRATVGSLRNMTAALAMLAGDFLCILFADSLGTRYMLAAAGFIMLPAAFFYLNIAKTAESRPTRAFISPNNSNGLSIIEIIFDSLNKRSRKELNYAPVVSIPRACRKRNSSDRRTDPSMYLVPRIYPPLPCPGVF
jgi:predicted MFS family arabinose efflux permease